MKPTATLFAIALFAFVAGADTKVQLKDLPTAAQKAIAEQTKGAEIRGYSRETENGKTTWEAETLMNGRHRDVSVDAKGNVVAIEEETAIETIPAPAKAAIEKRAAGGKIGMVETVTKGGAVAFYEAQYTTKAGKRTEVAVKADGTLTKD